MCIMFPVESLSHDHSDDTIVICLILRSRRRLIMNWSFSAHQSTQKCHPYDLFPNTSHLCDWETVFRYKSPSDCRITFICCLLEDQQWSILCICLRSIPYLFSITLIISYIYVYMYSYHIRMEIERATGYHSIGILVDSSCNSCRS